jgi:D-xylose 1-dehydrogenase (NADP+, D-xylono-1,5-lactone-forming)
MGQPLRLGILGTGNIARQFAAGLAGSTRTRAVAVASRGADTAGSFAAAHGVPRAYGSYDQLLRDRDVDAVYVSLPNSMHREWAVAALRAGKHVLCEKPIAAGAGEAEEMFDAAGRAGCVLVEAFMYRSHPLTHAVLDTIRGGEIGRVGLVRTSFCFRTTRTDGNIRFDASLAGGALMDVGCYCLNFSRLVAGAEPVRAHAVGTLHASGVDETAAAVLAFPDGVGASFTCGMSVQADNTAYVCGTEGFVEVPVPWKPPRENAEYSVVRGTPPRMDGPVRAALAPARQTRRVTAAKELYALEADDFAAAVLDGVPPRVDRADSVGNMRLLDELRRQVGVTR